MTRLEQCRRRLIAWRAELNSGGSLADAAPTAIALLEEQIERLQGDESSPTAAQARRLTPQMRRALKAVCQETGHASHNSVGALIRRGLVHGFVAVPTALGREVNSYLVEHGAV